MPYNYSRLFKEVAGYDYPNRPVFDALKLSPLRKPIEESTIGIFGSCGAQLPEDPPLKKAGDLSFRLVHRDTPLSKLVVSHETKIRKWALEDLNVAFPLDRMKELEAEGAFRRLAPIAVSMVGSIQMFADLVQQTVPGIKQVFDAQGVDLVVLFPFCPSCHRAVAVIARALEARGLPTMSMITLWEAAQETKPPRSVFLDFPLGCPAGKPHEPAQQREILRAALKLAPEFDTDRWEMKTLPFQWSADGNRAWEKEVDDLYRNGGIGIAQQHHEANKANEFKSIVGHEREFAIQCNC